MNAYLYAIAKLPKSVHSARSGATANERSATPNNAALPAGCHPLLTVVPLLQSNDPFVVYKPQCTRVMRCSGCCSAAQLKCMPTQVETMLLDVRMMTYDPSTNKATTEWRPTAVEVHTACECLCRLKEKDCNHLQQYEESDCSCNCTNEGERSRCLVVSVTAI